MDAQRKTEREGRAPSGSAGGGGDASPSEIDKEDEHAAQG